MGASATAGRWRRSLHHRSNAFLGVLKMKPRQLLIGEHMLARFQLLRPVEGTDTIMCLGRKMHGRAVVMAPSVTVTASFSKPTNTLTGAPEWRRQLLQ